MEWNDVDQLKQQDAYAECKGAGKRTDGLSLARLLNIPIKCICGEVYSLHTHTVCPKCFRSPSAVTDVDNRDGRKQLPDYPSCSVCGRHPLATEPWCDCGTPDPRPRKRGKLTPRERHWVNALRVAKERAANSHATFDEVDAAILWASERLEQIEDAITEAGIYLSAGDIATAMKRLEKVMGPDVLKRQGI